MFCGKFVDQLRPGFQAYGAKLVQQLTVIALVEQRRRLVSQLLVQIGLRRVRRIMHGGTAVLRFANMKCERMRLRRGDLELQCCGIVFGQLRNASAHLAFLRARLPRRLRLRWELEFDLGAQGWVVVILQLTVILLREVLCVPLPRPAKLDGEVRHPVQQKRRVNLVVFATASRLPKSADQAWHCVRRFFPARPRRRDYGDKPRKAAIHRHTQKRAPTGHRAAKKYWAL